MKRADALRVEEKRRGVRPRLRREDCVKRDLVGVEIKREGWVSGDGWQRRQ